MRLGRDWRDKEGVMRNRFTTWRTCGLVLGLGVGLGGCGPAEDPVARLAPQAETNPGGVVLDPGTIRGRAHFTNQNPDILALVDAERRLSPRISATSTSPTGYSASQVPAATNFRGFDFEMLVEAEAGGPTGVTYRLNALWASSPNLYVFQPVNALVRPREVQPGPTEVDIAECIGVLRFSFGTDDTCQTPVPVSSPSFNNLALTSGTSRHYYVRGGTSGTGSLVYFTTLNGSSYRHQASIPWSAACDQLVDLCIPVDEGVLVPPAPPPPPPGSLTGPWELIGETIVSRSTSVDSGPGGRSASITRPGSAPAADPSTWWLLSNVASGGYRFYGAAGVRLGDEYTVLRTIGQSITVLEGQTLDLGQVRDGQLRYPLAMHPAYFQGSIRLVDPYVVSQPGARSPLSALIFASDRDANGDGVPDLNLLDDNRPVTVLAAGGGSVSYSRTSFPRRFAPATGELQSSYEQILPLLYDQPATWAQSSLRLGFWAEGTSSTSLWVTRPSEYDPARFRYGSLSIAPRQGRSALLGPGQSHRIDHEYCFGQVDLAYSSPGARFYNPTVTINGSFRGNDWRGQAVDYTVSGQAWGVPAAINIPQAEAVTYAASSGAVSFGVPEGTYTLNPSAIFVNDSGIPNSANFQAISFTVGCGQRLRIVPPLAVSVNPQPSCAEGPAATITGRVQSSPAEVDRIWYRLNGGPEVPVCTNCGVNPTFSLPVTLAACENTIQVYAYTAGLPEPATGVQQLIWDDPTDGPSCADTSCVNRAPVARCQNLVLAANSACQGCGTVDAGSYDPDGGEVTCAMSAECPFALGRHRVTLTCTDALGASASCDATVTVTDQTPPELSCPGDQVLECVAGGAQASFLPTAIDRCSAVGQPSCAPASGASFPVGTTAVTCSVSDAAGNRASCSFGVRVADSQPPSIQCPAPVVAECVNGQANVVLGQAQASDGCTSVTVNGPTGGSYPVGTSSVTYTATDAAGHAASCTTSVTVADTAPPQVSVGEPLSLWPPHHALRRVSLRDCGLTVRDACSGELANAALRARILCVSSDEKVEARGSGQTATDIVLLDEQTVELRAERSGRGDGRVYRIRFEVEDAAGHRTPGECVVGVPHDQSGPRPADSGEQYRVCR
jgi:hypothetical protein